jgi:hypothetical protein
VVVSLSYVLIWLAPRVYHSIFPPDFQNLPKVTPVEVWRGRIPIAKKAAAIQAGKILTNQRALDASWKILDPNGLQPTVDFFWYIAVVHVGSNTNQVGTDFRIARNGAVANVGFQTGMATLGEPTHVAYFVAVLPRWGIWSVDGTPVPWW